MTKKEEIAEKYRQYLMRRGAEKERERCVRILQDYIKAYPASLFPATSKERSAIVATGLREMLPVVLLDIQDPTRLSE